MAEAKHDAAREGRATGDSSTLTALERRFQELLDWVIGLVRLENGRSARKVNRPKPVRRMSLPQIAPEDFFEGGIHTLVRKS